jgi:hypothetical protein
MSPITFGIRRIKDIECARNLYICLTQNFDQWHPVCTPSLTTPSWYTL